jgi:hypothetical protein
MCIEDKQDNTQAPKRSMDITYSCLTFDRLLQSIPFYLQLSTELNYYKESNIGYVQIVNGENAFSEPQPKIFAYVRQGLDLESRLDKGISDANFPPGFGKLITLELDHDYRDRCSTADIVGVKLPILKLEIAYTQGQPKEKWSKSPDVYLMP